MKKIIAAVLICLTLCSNTAEAKKAYVEPVEGNPLEECVKIRCTCYCEHGITATGIKTRDGIAAGKEEWLGYTAELNAINPDGSIGEYIGIYEFKDTGAGMDTDGDGKGDSIKNGQSIDIWMTSLPEAYAFRDKYGDYVYIRIYKAEG